MQIAHQPYWTLQAPVQPLPTPGALPTNSHHRPHQNAPGTAVWAGVRLGQVEQLSEAGIGQGDGSVAVAYWGTRRGEQKLSPVLMLHTAPPLPTVHQSEVNSKDL